MSLLVIGLSHHTAPVELRERFAFAEPELPAMLQRLRDEGLAEEVVVLSTCNRVEIYATTSEEPRQAFAAMQAFLRTHASYEAPLTNELYQLAEPHSLVHLFKVACGLDSMVLGETEVLGQLKKAYDLALRHRQTGKVLNRAFQKAFNVAKHVRTHTLIQRGSVSVASVGVELAEKIFNTLEKHVVLVIGAGDTSEKAARALLSRGARSVLVANRSHERAEALAAELGGRAVRFENWADEFEHIDIAISSTSAPHYILDPVKLEPLMKRRRNRPLLLIDLAVPRDIDPEVNRMDDVYLYNVDDLQAMADESLNQRRAEIAQCEALIREKAQALTSANGPAHLPRPSEPAFGHE